MSSLDGRSWTVSLGAGQTCVCATIHMRQVHWTSTYERSCRMQAYPSESLCAYVIMCTALEYLRPTRFHTCSYLSRWSVHPLESPTCFCNGSAGSVAFERQVGRSTETPEWRRACCGVFVAFCVQQARWRPARCLHGTERLVSMCGLHRSCPALEFSVPSCHGLLACSLALLQR